MRRSAWIVAVCGLIASHVFAQDIEFKGLALGRVTTPSQVEAQLTPNEALRSICGQSEGPCADRIKVSCSASDGGVQVCNGKTTIAGSLADTNAVIGSDGRLQRIFMTFSSDSYDVVHDALLKKFGKPSSVKKSAVQNGFGAQFMQVDTVWLRGGGLKLSLSRYGANTDESVAYFGTKADEDLFKDAGNSSDL